jgi:3-hydroxyisobutyrate dehydrogenase
MYQVGFIGVGKIGLPICRNLIERGVSVIGYRRSSLAEFEAAGGVAAASAAEVAEKAEVVFSCVPDEAALDEVIQGGAGVAAVARPGQIVVEFGSHPLPALQRQEAALAARGAVFLDGEVSGTPGMVAARKAVIYLGGDKAACEAIAPLVEAFAPGWYHFGPIGTAATVKLINNLLVIVNIAATAEAMALALKTDVDPATLIKAVSEGSGGSTQFAIRAPWMAEGRFTPAQGEFQQLAHYFDLIGDFADEVGSATPLMNCAAELYRRGIADGMGAMDVAGMIEVIRSLPQPKAA